MRVSRPRKQSSGSEGTARRRDFSDRSYRWLLRQLTVIPIDENLPIMACRSEGPHGDGVQGAAPPEWSHRMAVVGSSGARGDCLLHARHDTMPQRQLGIEFGAHLRNSQIG